MGSLRRSEMYEDVIERKGNRGLKGIGYDGWKGKKKEVGWIGTDKQNGERKEGN